MESKGRKLHGEAAKAREAEKFTQSLTFNDDALFAYDAEDDALGFSEAISCRSITLRVYGDLHDSKRILTLAKYETMAAVDLARQSGIKEALGLPLYNLAKLQEYLGELDTAVKTYKEAVDSMENNPPETHKKVSVLADMKTHMAACEYKAGDKSALQRGEQALEVLESSDDAPNKYSKDVWVSGGYMMIADAIKIDEATKAKHYLNKAKDIIDSNPELTLRKKQWSKISASLSAS